MERGPLSEADSHSGSREILCLLEYSQEPAAGPYPGPDESNLYILSALP